jgi:hypothetical protein
VQLTPPDEGWLQTPGFVALTVPVGAEQTPPQQSFAW